MRPMLAACSRFRWDDEGADLIEYALLASIIAFGVSAILSEYIVGVGGLLQTLIDTLGSILS